MLANAVHGYERHIAEFDPNKGCNCSGQSSAVSRIAVCTYITPRLIYLSYLEANKVECTSCSIKQRTSLSLRSSDELSERTLRSCVVQPTYNSVCLSNCTACGGNSAAWVRGMEARACGAAAGPSCRFVLSSAPAHPACVTDRWR
jgi:hypothetical protein